MVWGTEDQCDHGWLGWDVAAPIENAGVAGWTESTGSRGSECLWKSKVHPWVSSWNGLDWAKYQKREHGWA